MAMLFGHAHESDGGTDDILIPNELIDDGHMRRMHRAFWLYMYLLREAGPPPSSMTGYRHDATPRGVRGSRRTKQRHMTQLVDQGYITVERAPDGSYDVRLVDLDAVRPRLRALAGGTEAAARTTGPTS